MADELTRIRETLGTVEPPEPRLETVVRRARRLRLHRIGAAGLVAIVAAAGIGLPLWVLAGFGSEVDRTPGGPARAIDLAVSVPDGWDARVLEQEGGALRLEVANYPLPDDIPGPPLAELCAGAVPEDVIPCEEAIRIAEVEGISGDRPPVSVFLELRPATGGDEVAAWVVGYEDVLQPLFGPVGRPPPDCSMGPWSVVIDATTGRVISEGGTGLAAVPCEGEGSRLGADQVRVVIVDRTPEIAPPGAEGDGEPGFSDEDFEAVDGPVVLGASDFGVRVEGRHPEHAIALRSARIQGVPLTILAEFGTDPAPVELLRQVNRILATLQVSALPTDGRTPGPPPTPAPTDPQGATVRHADVDDGLAIELPAGWTFRQDPSGPDDPGTVFAFGTWAFPTGGDCAPTAAQAELPDDGALVWVIEYLSPETLQFVAPGPEPRPESFALDPATLATYECSLVPSHMAMFSEFGRDGRVFQFHAAFGPDAGEETREQVLAALDSLDVTAPVPDGCPAGTGPWSDNECPWPAWSRAVLEKAGYRVTGDTGSALVARSNGAGIYFWAFPPEDARPLPEALSDEGYRVLTTVDGVEVFTDGIRAAWAVQGLWVWVEGGPVDRLPGVDAVEPLVRASLAVDYDAIDTR
ncbi:MAG: hypothetical protein HY658_02405 [Actinobacteria bacterium]|nr:hypothetical protein [Actinomycetota bacterium]